MHTPTALNTCKLIKEYIRAINDGITGKPSSKISFTYFHHASSLLNPLVCDLHQLFHRLGLDPLFQRVRLENWANLESNRV